MSAFSDLDMCLPFIESQSQYPAALVPGPIAPRHAAPRLAITISRQSGSGAHAVGEKLAQYLQTCVPHETLPWMLFDRNLVEHVLEDHNLPRRLAPFMTEDRVTGITDMIEELFGLHPPFYTLVDITTETIQHLAEQGNVILIGRGANVIARNLPHVFHVRLVASLEKRVAHMQELRGLSAKAARELVLAEDRGRRRYLKKYFHQDFDNPLLYNLVINTDHTTYDDAARLICEAALQHLRHRTLDTAAHRTEAASTVAPRA